MQFKTYKPRPKLKIVPTTLFSLEERAGDISLIAVDNNGKRVSQGFILSIRKNGTFDRSHSVSPKLGLKLDGKGRIVERKA